MAKRKIITKKLKKRVNHQEALMIANAKLDNFRNGVRVLLRESEE